MGASPACPGPGSRPIGEDVGLRGRQWNKHAVYVDAWCGGDHGDAAAPGGAGPVDPGAGLHSGGVGLPRPTGWARPAPSCWRPGGMTPSPARPPPCVTGNVGGCATSPGVDEPDGAFGRVVCRGGLMFSARPAWRWRDAAVRARQAPAVVAISKGLRRATWLRIPVRRSGDQENGAPADLPGPFSLSPTPPTCRATRRRRPRTVRVEGRRNRSTSRRSTTGGAPCPRWPGSTVVASLPPDVAEAIRPAITAAIEGAHRAGVHLPAMTSSDRPGCPERIAMVWGRPHNHNGGVDHRATGGAAVPLSPVGTPLLTGPAGRSCVIRRGATSGHRQERASEPDTEQDGGAIRRERPA